ncbi:MAG: multidrug efflux pump subunit AcrB [Gammaproteobacteria bacterium]|jgi:multidrug efflux pump subunit AcrB
MIAGGGIAAWSIRHPIGVVMLALAVIVLGGFSLDRLGVDLLPHIIYPEVRVRILDSGVPGNIMEDQVTRQLEEQLAITEDAIGVQSRTQEGRSAVDLSFPYGKDIDVALRDASSRLDRAKRFLPDTIDPPVIFKRDPSQIPVLEFVISSPLRDPVELRTWLDYSFSKWFLNLPGVASTEIGGAPVREIAVVVDQDRLVGHGLSVQDIVEALQRANQELPGGALKMEQHEITSRTSARFTSVESIATLPLGSGTQDGAVLRLSDVAEVHDSAADEKLRIRLNGVPGLKLAVQKQPQANTVSVVDAVKQQLKFLNEQGLIPSDVSVDAVEDQAIYVRQALHNAAGAGASGAALAMLVVFLFLGDLRRTLIIGSGIPFAVMVALVIMDMAGLTLNIMTLGGLALGMGMLVDNTIVMLENIYRHQRAGDNSLASATTAAAEVHGAIIASTSTNLAAVLPFLFIGGLVGLVFQELIATISAAMVASMVVAITVVPALAARVPAGRSGLMRRTVDHLVNAMANGYVAVLRPALKAPWLIALIFAAVLVWCLPAFTSGKNIMMPALDDGKIRIEFTGDAGTSLGATDEMMARVEEMLLARDDVATVYSQVGGFVFGRSQYEASNRGRIAVQLVALEQRTLNSNDWVKAVRKSVAKLQMAGVRVRIRVQGIRGLRLGSGDDDFSIRIRGDDLDTLSDIGEQVVRRIEDVTGLSNVRHSSEDVLQELAVRVDRERAAALGVDVQVVGDALRVALQGVVATDYIEGDQQFEVRVRLPRAQVQTAEALGSVLLFPTRADSPAVRLREVATIDLVNTPSNIKRDRQQRIVEVSASIGSESTLGEVNKEVWQRLSQIPLPDGYSFYDGGEADALSRSENLMKWLLGLALFLVLVVMSVQYESLRNPLVILASVPFAAIGVAIALLTLELPLSMPMWLGMVMLAGIVVNNAIVLVEYVEIARARGLAVNLALVEAARIRLRPILMTTLTTVVGMAPLAAGLGEGAEMLQPLAITIVYGLSFSTLVSLLLVPSMYRMFASNRAVATMHDALPTQAS